MVPLQTADHPCHLHSYDQEQKELKKQFLKSINGLDEDQTDAEGGLLSFKQKTAEEIAAEEAQYEKWLQGEGKAFDNKTKEDLEPLRRFWTDPNLNENDRFLRDYVTKQLWKAKDGSTIPEAKAISDSEDEQLVDEAEEFERKFNFRFEEAESSEVWCCCTLALGTLFRSKRIHEKCQTACAPSSPSERHNEMPRKSAKKP